MSAVAQFFLAQNHEISGSDLAPSKVTDILTERGVKIFFEHDAKNLPDGAELVVYTTAVDPKNPELKKARELNIQTISYSEALGLVSKNKFVIAVSGTHGKTTTTAMVAKIMIDAGLSPTVIAGSIMTDFGSNFVLGDSQYFVVEACEYRRTFLHIQPNVLIITNIEEDHLDYYKDLKDIQSAFLELAKKLKKDDFLICDINHPNLEPIIRSKEVECNIIDYKTLDSLMPKLRVPGRHNEENAKSALAVAAIFGIDEKSAGKSLENFQGTWRRMEQKGKTSKGAIVFDDYAHHPTEIRASIASLKKMFPEKKIIIVFQAHLFSRTKSFLKEFGESFKGAEEVIIAPIYAAREEADPEIDHKILSEEIKKTGLNSRAFDNFEEIANYLQTGFDSSYIIATMGAGDINKVAGKIISN